LIRALGDDGRAICPWAPSIGQSTLHHGPRSMTLTRALEERLFRAHRQGMTSFYMKSTGEEAIGAAHPSRSTAARCAFVLLIASALFSAVSRRR